MPASKLKVRIAEVLKDEGFIDDVASRGQTASRASLTVELKYGHDNRKRHHGHQARLKPGPAPLRAARRHSQRARAWASRSSPPRKGVMTDREARKQGLGGELICAVW